MSVILRFLLIFSLSIFYTQVSGYSLGVLNYDYDAVRDSVFDQNIKSEIQKNNYDDTINLQSCCGGISESDLLEKTQNGSFFAFDASLDATKSVGQLTRTFTLNGRQVSLIGGGTPVVGRTLKNGLTEVKTSISGGIDDAAQVFSNLVGNAAKPLGNGKGFRAVLENGREVIFRPISSGRSGGIPKIEIRDFATGVSEKINFTR